MAFLQAFADDSASDVGDRRLFVAGYLNWAERWAEFSDAWSKALAEPPSIDYLKMSEAQGLRGQFDGWESLARDKKLEALSGVIQQFGPLSFQFSTSRRDFDEFMKPNSPRPLAKPHFDNIFGVICMMANWSDQSGLHVPIDFIFDEQEGVSADVDLFFEQMTVSLPPSAKKLINGKPSFLNDRQVLPLQAADMLAWHLRREHERGEEMPLLANLRQSGAHFLGEIPLEQLKAWAAEFKQVPGVPTVQSKGQWQKVRRAMISAAEVGFVPPKREPGERIQDYARRCFSMLTGKA